jgi:hypothetical protein
MRGGVQLMHEPVRNGCDFLPATLCAKAFSQRKNLMTFVTAIHFS